MSEDAETPVILAVPVLLIVMVKVLAVPRAELPTLLLPPLATTEPPAATLITVVAVATPVPFKVTVQLVPLPFGPILNTLRRSVAFSTINLMAEISSDT